MIDMEVNIYKVYVESGKSGLIDTLNNLDINSIVKIASHYYSIKGIKKMTKNMVIESLALKVEQTMNLGKVFEG